MPLAATLAAEGVCHLTVSGGDLYREPGILYTPNAGPPEFYRLEVLPRRAGDRPDAA